MKKALIVLSILYCNLVSAQTQQEIDNLVTLTKVWGFLKYHHPEVAKGKLDWDKEFMDRVKPALDLKTKEETSKFYLDWINSLGKVKICKKCEIDVPNEPWNSKPEFIYNTNFFNGELKDKLEYIRRNRNQSENYYCTPFKGSKYYHFETELAYSDSVNPSKNLRLLALARFWNVNQYFFPYLYINDNNWDSVLVEMVPKFYHADKQKEYIKSVLELTAKINDSHAGLSFEGFRKIYGYKMVPFTFNFFEKKLMIIGSRNDSLLKRDDIEMGDVILKINNTDVQTIIDTSKKYVAYSNEGILYRKAVSYFLLRSNDDSLFIEYERDGVVNLKWIHLTQPNQLDFFGHNIEKYKILKDNIGYVNMGVLEKADVGKMMDSLMRTKAIIFDIRNYPRGTMYDILEYLNDTPTDFVKFTYPNIHFPGTFEMDKPVKCGGGKKTHYKGKVIVLVNEETQSHAEFTTMSFQTIKGMKVIGSQTSGADGNGLKIFFPGGYNSILTGIGVYYPDGRETQRIGIVPDIEVKPTIKGIREERDEVLEKAIEVINAIEK